MSVPPTPIRTPTPAWSFSLALHLLLAGALLAWVRLQWEWELAETPALVELVERASTPQNTAPAQRVRSTNRATPKPAPDPAAAGEAPRVPPAGASDDAADGLPSGEAIAADYDVAELPVLLREKRVPYPPAAKSQGVSGDVIAELVIGANGKVLQAKILNSAHPLLAEAAQGAFREFEFKPARMDGRAIGVRIRYRYRFMIEN
jgi:TonB family protein